MDTYHLNVKGMSEDKLLTLITADHFTYLAYLSGVICGFCMNKETGSPWKQPFSHQLTIDFWERDIEEPLKQQSVHFYELMKGKSIFNHAFFFSIDRVGSSL